MERIRFDARAFRSAALCVGAASIAIACGLTACQWLVPLEAEVAVNGDAGAAVDAGDAAETPDAGDAGACGRRPAAPGAATQQGAGSAYYFVLTTAALASDGFDLDCIDSRCEGAAAPTLGCVPRGTGPYCDGTRGVDNAMLVARDRKGLTIDLDKYYGAMRVGVSGLVFGILGYDGTPNDSDVTFVMFPARAEGVPNECPVNPAELDGGATPAVLLNGCDTFQGDNQRIALGTPLTTVHGYVTGGRLVVTEPHDEWIPYGSRYLAAEGLFLEGTLHPASADAPMKLEATLGGRVTARALLSVLGEQRIAPDPPLCLGTSWSAIRRAACEELDMARAGAAANEPCDALSYALSVKAVAVRLSRNTVDPDVLVSRDPRCTADSGVAGSDNFTCD